jgi:hypothetical protein
MSDRMVRLDIEEWQRVLGVLAQAPWATANPLIMKIGDQLRMQEPAPAQPYGVGEPAQPEPPTRQ